MKITILGSGGWGTALANLLSENEHQVTLWSFLKEECENLQKTRENPFLKGIALHPAISFTNDLSAVADAEVVVIATPSFAVRSTSEKIAKMLPENCVLVSVTKGIEAGTSLRMSEIISSVTGKTVAVLSGPSHAEEVGRGVPTTIVVGARKRDTADYLQNIFMNPVFRVYTSPDVKGIELGAALKNVVALAAGIADGLGYGDNIKAALITRGIREISRLATCMGAKMQTLYGLSGMGDP